MFSSVQTHRQLYLAHTRTTNTTQTFQHLNLTHLYHFFPLGVGLKEKKEKTPAKTRIKSTAMYKSLLLNSSGGTSAGYTR